MHLKPLYQASTVTFNETDYQKVIYVLECDMLRSMHKIFFFSFCILLLTILAKSDIRRVNVMQLRRRRGELMRRQRRELIRRQRGELRWRRAGHKAAARREQGPLLSAFFKI